MNRKLFSILTVCVLFLGTAITAIAEDLKPTKLPEPNLDQTKSLAQALRERKTTREFTSQPLPDQVLSNLLWSAWGINRPDSGRRTAPSSKNRQEIDLYVSTANGTYIYEAKSHILRPVVSGDHRNLTFSQEPFQDAPVNIVFVADLNRMGEGVSEENKMLSASVDTGFIAQNIYLYCAVSGLNTGYRVTLPKDKFAQIMKLKSSQKIIGAQSVGLPISK